MGNGRGGSRGILGGLREPDGHSEQDRLSSFPLPRPGGSRPQSASTKGPSLYHAFWICGPTSVAFSRPGKRLTTPLSKHSTAAFRAECLNAHWFLILADAQKKLEDWRKYYNEERPHGAIGQKPPITLLNHDGAASPPS